MTLALTSDRSAIFRSCGPTDRIGASEFGHRARLLDEQVARQTLPFWHDDAVVPAIGGYRFGNRAGSGRFDERTQLLVSQARLLWSFSRAHRLGYSTADRDYLAAARHGYAWLNGAFLDAEQGGYFWRLRDGVPADANKLLYGQSFALYALVEYGRAVGDAGAIERGLSLFRTLMARPRTDDEAGLPVELAGRDFGAPLLRQETYAGLAACGYRCANTVLHWMEALTELYRETGDAAVRHALLDALRANLQEFYPPNLGIASYYVPRSAMTSAWPKPVDLSYGHNVEFGWLMIDAQRALGLAPDWQRLESIVAHTLRHGFDHRRGGVYNAGVGDAPAHDRRKGWWQQAEMIAALTYLESSGAASRSYAAELKLMLDWYFGPQMDAATGNPVCEVASDGATLDATISGEWQAGYHDLRARWIFIGAHSPDAID